MKTFRRLLKVLSKHQRRLIVILLLMMVAGAGLETIGTSLLLPVIEIAMDPAAVLGNRYMRFVYNLLHLTSTEGFLMLIITAIIIIYIVKNLYLYLMYYAQYRFVYRGQYLTSRAVFKDYVDRPYEFFLDASTPLMIRHVCSDVAGTYSLLLTYLRPVLPLPGDESRHDADHGLRRRPDPSHQQTGLRTDSAPLRQ